MILIVSFFSLNKGTTDYFRDYLKSHKISHYYLRHPFSHAGPSRSELILFDGVEDIIVQTFLQLSGELLDLMKDFITSLYISIKLGHRITEVYSFSGFNTAPFLLFKNHYRRKINFWGVDYSTRRFKSNFLNRLYLTLESSHRGKRMLA